MRHAARRGRAPHHAGRLRAFLVLLSIATLAFASRALASDLGEVDRCIGANAPERTMVQDAEITSLDRSGADRTQSAKIYWKRSPDGLSRAFLRVEAPPDLRGSAFLMVQREDANDMWMYLPELRKVRRITPRTVSGSLFGTDFSYEDIDRIQTLGRSQRSERLPDGEVEARGVYVVASTPDPESGSAYARIVSYVDKETCVPLKTEFFDDADELRKVLVADPDKITREANAWVPRHLTMKDLRRETESRLVVEEISFDEEVPDRRFSLSQLEKGR